MTNIKENASLPKFTPIQVVIMIGAVIFFIVTSTDWFADLPDIVKVVSYVAVMIVILLFGTPLGSVTTFIGNVIKILANGGTQEEKIIQIQNLVVALCQQLGIYYEREKEKAIAELTAKKEELEKELSELENEA